MPRSVPIHVLSHNKAERTPKHVLILDTETRWSNDTTIERHKLRLWVLRHRHRHANQHRNGNVADHTGTTGRQLAEAVHTAACHGSATWLYAHKAGFDLAVSGLLTELGRLGWKLNDNALTLPNPWARLNFKRHSLTIADSASILPRPLRHLGDVLGIVKPKLPENDDSDEAWYQRCRADVEILDAALEQLMGWWDDHKRGCWSLTGPALGWNMYRHKYLDCKVTIDPDPIARTFERTAIYGGRRDVWKVGKQPAARYLEIDFEHAHLTVAEQMALPVRRGNRFVGEPRRELFDFPDNYGLIADVTIATDTPRYPCRIDGAVFHPVGTFRTTLAWPELCDAQKRGLITQWHGGYRYRLGHSMESWGAAVKNILDDPLGQHPPMAHVAAQSWSRTVPGKWATRTSELAETLPSVHQDLTIERGTDYTTGNASVIVHMGGIQQWFLSEFEADNSFPAVLAFIQSYTRVALNNLIDQLPPKSILSCNTDGLICSSGIRRNVEQLAAQTAPLIPRIKATYHRVEVFGPAHIIHDGEHRMSGIPKTAHQTGAAQWEWLTWPSFARQQVLTDGAGYTRKLRKVALHEVPVPRWVRTDGQCDPPLAYVTRGGVTRLHGRDAYPWPLSAAALREGQHRALKAANGHTGRQKGMSPNRTSSSTRRSDSNAPA